MLKAMLGYVKSMLRPFLSRIKDDVMTIIGKLFKMKVMVFHIQQTMIDVKMNHFEYSNI